MSSAEFDAKPSNPKTCNPYDKTSGKASIRPCYDRRRNFRTLAFVLAFSHSSNPDYSIRYGWPILIMFCGLILHAMPSSRSS